MIGVQFQSLGKNIPASSKVFFKLPLFLLLIVGSIPGLTLVQKHLGAKKYMCNKRQFIIRKQYFTQQIVYCGYSNECTSASLIRPYSYKYPHCSHCQLAGPARPVRQVQFWQYHFLISRHGLYSLGGVARTWWHSIDECSTCMQFEKASCSRFVVPELLLTPHQPSAGLVFFFP